MGSAGRKPMRGLSRSLSDWEVEEAIASVEAGDSVDAVAARYGISAKTLGRIIKRAKEREEEGEKVAEARKQGDNALGRVNDYLFAEMERLDTLDASDPDALRLEIQRARAVEGMAKAAIDNANTILDVARLKAEYSGARVSVPKALAG